MVNMMLEFVRSDTSPPSLVHLSFKFLYIICKVSLTQCSRWQCLHYYVSENPPDCTKEKNISRIVFIV